MTIAGDFQRFGQKVKSGFQRFGQNARRDFQVAGKFVKEKALPAIEKVAGQVGRGITKYGIPIASVLAPELTPLLAGARMIAGQVGSGARTGGKLITNAEKFAGAVKSGNVDRINQAGLEGKVRLQRAFK